MGGLGAWLKGMFAKSGAQRRFPESAFQEATQALDPWMRSLTEREYKGALGTAGMVLGVGPFLACKTTFVQPAPWTLPGPPSSDVYRGLFWHVFWFVDVLARQEFLSRGVELSRLSKFWALMPGAYRTLMEVVTRSVTSLPSFVPDIGPVRYEQYEARYIRRYLFADYTADERAFLDAVPTEEPSNLKGFRLLFRDVASDMLDQDESLRTASTGIYNSLLAQALMLWKGHYFSIFDPMGDPLGNLPDGAYDRRHL